MTFQFWARLCQQASHSPWATRLHPYQVQRRLVPRLWPVLVQQRALHRAPVSLEANLEGVSLEANLEEVSLVANLEEVSLVANLEEVNPALDNLEAAHPIQTLLRLPE